MVKHAQMFQHIHIATRMIRICLYMQRCRNIGRAADDDGDAAAADDDDDDDDGDDEVSTINYDDGKIAPVVPVLY